MPGNVLVSHRRTRNGCLCCRARRRKCDGYRPQCQNCKKRSVDCQWGLRASFHPSRHIGLSIDEERTLLAIESKRKANRRQRSRRSAFTIIDDTKHVIESYIRASADALVHSDSLSSMSEDGEEDYSEADAILGESLDFDLHQNSSHGGDVLPANESAVAPQGLPSRQDFSIVEIPSSGNDQNDTTNLRVGLTDTIETDYLETILSSHTYTPPFSLGLALCRKASPFREPQVPINDAQALVLLRSYLSESATWCETTDTERHFSVICAHDMLENRIFKASALALASRQLHMTGIIIEDIPLQCYQYTVQLLIQQDPSQADGFILASCTLLCVYEMMASDVADWRRHLKGCAGLFSSRGWNGSSKGLIQACFWAFARIDLWAAFLLGKNTLIPTNCWVDDESIERAAAIDCPDQYCNLSILTFARLVNYLSKEEIPNTASEPVHDAQALWLKFQRWWKSRPKRARPLYRTGPTKLNPFPTIFFTYGSSICGNTFYHAGSLLLLKHMTSLPGGTLEEDSINPLWHAQELCGISTSNVDHANWVNHLQPLFIAGQVFANPQNFAGHRPMQSQQSETSQTWTPIGGAWGFSLSPSSGTRFGEEEDQQGPHMQYASEQIALLKHLLRIQRQTGWKTEGRAEELRKLWGFQ